MTRRWRRTLALIALGLAAGGGGTAQAAPATPATEAQRGATYCRWDATAARLARRSWGSLAHQKRVFSTAAEVWQVRDDRTGTVSHAPGILNRSMLTGRMRSTTARLVTIRATYVTRRARPASICIRVLS